MALFNIEDDPYNLMGGDGSAGYKINMTAPASAAGSPGADSILQSLMKQNQEERDSLAKSREDQLGKNRLSTLKRAGIAALIAALAGGKGRGGNMAGAVLEGGAAAKKNRDAQIISANQEALKGNEARRNEIIKSLGDISQERAKAQIKAQSPDGSKEMTDFVAIHGRRPKDAAEYNQFLLGRRSQTDQTTDKLAADILGSYQKTGKLTPQQEAILKSISNMRAYPSMYLPNAMGLVPGMPQVVPGQADPRQLSGY